MDVTRKLNITTSWDDGHPNDLRLAELLLKYGISGVFYIPLKNTDGRSVMTKKEIKELSKNFEIGGHTFGHVDLTKVPLNVAKKEIISGKTLLEEIIGKKVTKFCYPRGHYTKSLSKLVKECGFESARTARILNVNSISKRFNSDPNVHYYKHSSLVLVGHLLKNKDMQTLKFYAKNFNMGLNQIITSMINQMDELHIWGHSWEVYENGLDREFEDLLKVVS